MSDTMSDTVYANAALRVLALHAQGLTAPLPAEPYTPETVRAAIMNTVNRLFCVQIDSLQMVARSHFILLWSRIGSYDPGALEALAYSEDRQLFEYWLKEACLIALQDYRWCLPRMITDRAASAWWQNWLHNEREHNSAVVEQVLQRIHDEGGLRAAQFERPGAAKAGGWWDWKPAKRALEYLYAVGDLMVADRVRFQRVYDLRERVLPAWVDTEPPSEADMLTYYARRSMRALGVVHDPFGACDYTHTRRTTARSTLTNLIASGEFIQVQGLDATGKQRAWTLHRDDLPLLQRAADGDMTPQRTVFLTPFDNLFWAVGRDQALFGFRQVLECYKPAPQRIYGYFCLPILHGDTLVGRFDPKLERTTQTLRIRALHLEPNIEPSPELAAAIAATFGNFMRFHDARHLIIERSVAGVNAVGSSASDHFVALVEGYMG